MTGELADPVVVAFPLRGEGWVAVNSPADRIPSHGVNMLGQRYAFDFLRVDGRPKLHWHRDGWIRTVLLGVPTHECYAWGASVHAPFDAEVVRAVDGIAERKRVHPLRELLLVVKNALTFTPARLSAVLGNHVILQRAGLFAAFAHLSPGSVTVQKGGRVTLGGVIGRVGHTGQLDESAPALSADGHRGPADREGRAVRLASYEVQRGENWVRVENSIPGKTERVRYAEPPS